MKEMLNNKNSPTPQRVNRSRTPQDSRKRQMWAVAAGCLSAAAVGAAVLAALAGWMSSGGLPIWAVKWVGLGVGCLIAATAGLLRPPFAPERLFSGTGVRGHFVCQLPALLAGGGGATRLVGSCQAVFHAAVRVHLRQHWGQCQTKGLIEAGGDFSPPAFVCNGYTEG